MVNFAPPPPPWPPTPTETISAPVTLEAIKAAVADPTPRDLRESRGGNSAFLLGSAGSHHHLPWQDVIRSCLSDRSHSNILPLIVNEVAKVLAMSQRRIEVQTLEGKWLPSSRFTDDELVEEELRPQDVRAARTFLAGVTDEWGDQDRLWFNLGYHFESVGDCWGVSYVPEGSADRIYATVSKRALSQQADGSWLWEIDRSGGKRRVPAGSVKRLWNPDPDYIEEAFSEYRAMAKTLRRFEAVKELIAASIDEKLTANDILWLPLSEDEADDVVADYRKSSQSIRDSNGRISRSPFLLVSELEPKYISVGEGINAELMKLETQLLTDIARGASLPMQLVMEGPGQSNSWAEFLLEKNYLNFVIGPKASTLANVVTVWLLRPALTEFGAASPKRYRIGHAIEELVAKSANIADLVRLYTMFAVDRAALSDAAGSRLPELPEGVTEHDHWLQAAGKAAARTDEKTADFVEEDGSRQLGVETSGQFDGMDGLGNVDQGPSPGATGAIAAARRGQSRDHLTLVDDSWLLTDVEA